MLQPSAGLWLCNTPTNSIPTSLASNGPGAYVCASALHVHAVARSSIIVTCMLRVEVSCPARPMMNTDMVVATSVSHTTTAPMDMCTTVTHNNTMAEAIVDCKIAFAKQTQHLTRNAKAVQ